jgi:hypothetical protein
MPATSANLAGLVAVAVSSLVAIWYVRVGCLAYIFFCYGAWLAAWTTNTIFKMQKYRPTLYDSWFSDQEKGVYRQFALYIHRPKLALFFSTTLHWLRLGAVPFIIFALWHGFYVEGGLLAVFAFLCSHTIASMFPGLYFEDAVKRGNRTATVTLHILRHIQAIMKP